MDYEWDPGKAAANLRKHKVAFAGAALSLEDPSGRTMQDPDSRGEHRMVTIGADPSGRILITVHTRRKGRIRITSSRRANATERRDYEELE